MTIRTRLGRWAVTSWLPLVLSLASSASAAPPPSVPSALVREWAPEQLATTDIAWFDHGTTLEVDLTIQSEALRLELRPYSLRSPTFAVRVHDGQATHVSASTPTVSTYRGTVTSWPTAVVVASLTPAGLTAAIHDLGETWRIEPARRYDSNASPSTHWVLRPSATPLSCGVRDLGETTVTLSPDSSGAASAAPFGPGSGGGAPPTNCDMKRCEIAFDCDFEYYTLLGSSVMATVARVEAILNDVDYFYTRDLRTNYLLTNVVVRTAPYYADVSGGSLLEQFRDEWNTVQAGVPCDIAHLMTNKTNLSGYGGLAYVGVVCTGSRYGWSLDSAGIVGHEVGHNWGSSHCHDTSPCNNMCGACLSIGSNTRDIMLAHRATRTCLDDIPNPIDPFPPFARNDALDLDETDIVSGNSFVIDVLPNDHDVNCDLIHVASVDATSAKGGSIVVSSGTGLGGFDQIVYSPPTTGFAGSDRFTYTVSDGLLTATGQVDVTVRRRELAGHWRLDEVAGVIAEDASGSGNPGTLVGGSNFSANATAGTFGGGLQFDGVDDSVDIPALDLNTNAMTITAWVRRTGTQVAWAGLVFSRAGNTTAGLNFGTAHELRYHWAQAQFNWSSGLVVPNNQWTFVALVVEPNVARMYMKVGAAGSLQSAVHPAVHPVEEFDGALRLGVDPTSTARYFLGALDDVRVYRYALNATQIAEIASGGIADGPSPRNLDNQAPRHPVLTWDPGLTVDRHDVYFGTDPVALAIADPADPSYRGRHGAAALHPLPELGGGSSHAWAVDTVFTDGSIARGAVWQFTTRTGGYDESLRAYYRFDVPDISGVSVVDASGSPASPGTLQGGPLQITGQVGGAIDLDGVNDRMQAGALQLASNTVTFSAWIRRDGPQTGTNGIIFCRAGSTVAGLNLGSHHELRYHWDGTQWGWDSGLEVPDGEWCHVALVVEPDRATIYRNGTPAIHPASHPPEAFDGALIVGQDPGFSTRYFAGAIDEVAIWSRALSPAEITSLFAAGAVRRPVAGSSDTTAPSPSPLTWEQVPTAVSESSIRMQVTTASDPSAVEYRFECIAGPGHDSGWQQSPYYLDTEIPAASTCTYIARARDVSPNLNTGAPTVALSATTDGPAFRRGDVNLDGFIDIGDVIGALDYLFGGAPTTCLLAIDTNDSGAVNIADAIALLDYLFQAGSPPPAPFPNCGGDATPDALTCVTSGGC